jgi:hypothetical protein
MSVPVLAVPLFIVIAGTFLAVVRAVTLARAGRVQLPALFDVLALAVLAIGAVMAVRNVTWFGLALVVLLPAIITRMRGGAPAPLRRARANRLAAIATLALVALIAVAILGRPTSWFTGTYPSRAIPIMRALVARNPHAQILADVRYADWLIWEDPQTFSGRVAYDTSFELLKSTQLTAIAELGGKMRSARRLTSQFGIWMLYPRNRSVNRALLRRPGVRVVSRTRKAIIALNGGGVRS